MATVSVFDPVPLAQPFQCFIPIDGAATNSSEQFPQPGTRIYASQLPFMHREQVNTKDYKSKVDGIQTQLVPPAFDLNGRWGDGLILLFQKMVALATKEG